MGGLSSTTTSAPVFSTDVMIVASSSGDSVLGSITSTSTPSAASCSAASSARETIAEMATTVTSDPARLISATPSGIRYLLWHRTLGDVELQMLEEQHRAVVEDRLTYSRPLASYGVEGTTTLIPGRCVKTE